MPIINGVPTEVIKDDNGALFSFVPVTKPSIQSEIDTLQTFIDSRKKGLITLQEEITEFENKILALKAKQDKIDVLVPAAEAIVE